MIQARQAKHAALSTDFLEDAAMLRTLLDNINDGVYFTDLTRTIHYWNQGAEAITGYSSDEVVGRRCADNILSHVNDEGVCLCTSPSCPLVKCLKGETNHVERVYLHHKQGHRVPVRICAAPIRGRHGNIIGGLETFYDISTEIAALQEVDSLKESALLCPLTGVGNRRYCDQVLERTQRENLKRENPGVGFLFMDIDDFKSCNDIHGHAVGDIVLQTVARTISKDLRSFDFIGRWGGEEFIVVLPRMAPADLQPTAERLRTVIANTEALMGGGSLQVTVSMGATMGLSGESSDAMVARADALMYQSKKSGKNRVTVG